MAWLNFTHRPRMTPSTCDEAHKNGPGMQEMRNGSILRAVSPKYGSVRPGVAIQAAQPRQFFGDFCLDPARYRLVPAGLFHAVGQVGFASGIRVRFVVRVAVVVAVTELFHELGWRVAQVNRHLARLVGFDGSPIWRDRDVLSKWWQHRMAEDAPNMALFYNTTSLHSAAEVARLLMAGGEI